MMSLILIINAILNIVMSGLFFFYTNKYRYFFNQVKMIVYSSFSLYFLFIGFLKVKVAIPLADWSFNNLDLEHQLIFNITNLITCIFVIIFLSFGITFKGK